MTEKLIQEIHRLKDSLGDYSAREALDYIESYINIISREQPSLPSDLDEAAEKYSNTPCNFGDFVEIEYEFGEPIEKIVDDKMFVKDAFEYGAKWLAGQGISISGKVGIYGIDVETITEELRDAGFRLGEEVIVQIRKKQ